MIFWAFIYNLPASKLRAYYDRWRARTGQDAVKEHESNEKGYTCLKFDEKNDFVNIGNNHIRKFNHLTVTSEPSNKYVDHCESGMPFFFCNTQYFRFRH